MISSDNAQKNQRENQRDKIILLRQQIVSYLLVAGIPAPTLNIIRDAEYKVREKLLPPLRKGFADVPITPLSEALRKVAGALCWRQNAGYTDAAFLARYRYCEIVGPEGHFFSEQISAGFLNLAGATVYPPHSHPARETYFVLSENSEWQYDNGPWAPQVAGNRIEHESGCSHAMRTRADPLLALYLWEGAIGEAARLVE